MKTIQTGLELGELNAFDKMTTNVQLQSASVGDGPSVECAVGFAGLFVMNVRNVYHNT